MTGSLAAQTRAHLATAERNRIISLLLLESDSRPARPEPYECAAVIAFYSAVHLVNALLWERLRYEPGDHRSREAMVYRVTELRSVRAAYARLRDQGFKGRYVAGYRISRQEATVLIHGDLARLEQAVYGALGLAPPAR